MVLCCEALVYNEPSKHKSHFLLNRYPYHVVLTWPTGHPLWTIPMPFGHKHITNGYNSILCHLKFIKKCYMLVNDASVTVTKMAAHKCLVSDAFDLCWARNISPVGDHTCKTYDEIQIQHAQELIYPNYAIRIHI